MRATTLSILLFFLAAPRASHAVRPITPPAPEFPSGAAWINSRPFTMAQLKGRRVVVISFINLYSANSTRTIPYLNRLWNDYGLKGLMVLGVHSPDFQFDRDPVEIRAAVKRADIRFPVFADSTRAVWKAYKNDGWPAHYLIDHKGLIIQDHLGELGWADFEREVVLALERSGRRFPKEHVIRPDPPREDCGQATASLYLGARRGVKLLEIQPNALRAITESRDGEVAVLGRWATEEDAVRFSGGGQRMETRMRLVYRGAEAMAVFSRAGLRPGRVYVKQDNLWLHSGNANKDIEWDDEDRSYVLVDSPRLYLLTRNRKRRMDELLLYPDEKGVGLSSFEFSDYCQVEYGNK